MKITMIDACIFIDLFFLELTHLFFVLDLEFHTSNDVFEDLPSHHIQELNIFIVRRKLIVHNLKETDRADMLKLGFPKSLSQNDKTLLYLGNKLNATILSSDNFLRKYSTYNTIELHGVIWILDQLLFHSIIDVSTAYKKVESLAAKYRIRQINQKLLIEAEHLISKWNLIV